MFVKGFVVGDGAPAQGPITSSAQHDLTRRSITRRSMTRTLHSPTQNNATQTPMTFGPMTWESRCTLFWRVGSAGTLAQVF